MTDNFTDPFEAARPSAPNPSSGSTSISRPDVSRPTPGPAPGNDSFVDPLAPTPRAPGGGGETSFMGDVGRGLAHAGLSTVRSLGLAGAGALEAVTLGHAPEALTDPIFRGVDKVKAYQDTIHRPDTVKGRIGEAVGGLVGGLPTLGVGSLSQGQDIIQNGGTVERALAQTGLNAAANVAGLGLGGLGGASLVRRMAMQGAANAALGEGARVAGNALAPDDQQQEFDPLETAIGFGAGMGFGALPHRPAVTRPRLEAAPVDAARGTPADIQRPLAEAVAAPAVRYPDAAPGSLADAANAVHVESRGDGREVASATAADEGKAGHRPGQQVAPAPQETPAVETPAAPAEQAARSPEPAPAATADPEPAKPAESDRGSPEGTAPTDERAPSTQPDESAPARASANDDPQPKAVVDPSREVLESDITPSSGGPFENRGAADIAVRRAGGDAQVVEEELNDPRMQATAEMPQGLGNPFDAPAFRVEPLGAKGLLVYGDAQAARDALAAAGFRKPGRMQGGALRFDAADRDAIEGALPGRDKGKSEAQPFADSSDNFDPSPQAQTVRAEPERRSGDGIRMPEAKSWSASDSGQTKIASENRSTFDHTNPDIRYARAADSSAPGLDPKEVNEIASRVLRMNPEDAGVRVVDSFEKLPDAPRQMAQAQGVRDGDIRALHVDGQSWLLADQMRSPGDVQEAIFHEHYTHGGLRAKFGRELGPKLDELLTGVGGEDGVRRLAGKQGIDLSAYDQALADNPRINAQDKQRVLMEELLAHMSHLTGTLKRTVQEWAGAVRDWLRRNGLAELAKYNETDLAHVLKQARQAVIEKAGAANDSRPFYMRTPADRAQGETAGSQDRMRFERPTEDELHEAHSLAKNAVLGKAFDITPEGKENVVRYNDKEVARIAGPVNRSNLTQAIAEQIKPVEAKSREQTQTTAPLSDLPARRPGEERGAWLRRLSNGTAGEDVRHATALRAQQKIIGRHAIREMLAGRARAMDTADAVFGEYRKLFDKTHPAQNFANVDAFETGKAIPDADFRAFLTQMKPGFVQRINRMRELNPNALQHLIEHYLPHMYEDPQRAARVLSGFAQRNSVAGDKGFLKQRDWPTLKQAMDSGLRPITNNPVDWVLLRYAGMDKYIGALELRQELQDRGWLHKVTEGEQIPPGYARVSDPTFNGYAVPANFARDLTNYLDPGFSKYAAWRTLRGAQNFMVAADLGFSGFHATFTSTDNVIMHLDIAARRAAIGDSRGAATTLLKALTSVVTSPFEGHKLNQQWRGIREADANTSAILDALERGGARWKMSTTEYQNAIPKMARLFRQMMGTDIRSKLAGKTPAQIAIGAVRIPVTALQAVAEMGSYLIHHVLVPNQKMAARVLLYKYELDRRAGDLGQHRGDYAGILDAMHPDVVRQIAADVNDIVDFRLGQMTYDNRFWNRTVQDIAQAAVMAPGWQYGMIQTVAGAGKALKDLVSPGRFVAPLDKAGTITDAHMGRVGSNLSYFLTLALTLGGGMAALQYLLTGKSPESAKDYFFPKTGRKNDDDSDERLQLPNYWVDHYKLTTEPGRTLENKIHPFWKMFWEIGHNRDYFGTRIRDPDAPAWDQAREVGAYMASKFTPITVGSMQKGMQRNESTAQQVGHFFGVNNAPAGVARSEFQNYVMGGGDKGWGDYTKSQEDAQRKQQQRAASAALRRGDEPDYGKLSEDDIQKAQEDAEHPVPQLLFKYLTNIDKIKAYELATPEERKRYQLHEYLERMDLDRSAPFKRLPAERQAQIRQRLQAIRSNSP